jgi:hypothetical protein
MLNARGHDLVTAVQAVFEDLGFKVQNMDLIPEDGTTAKTFVSETGAAS